MQIALDLHMSEEDVLDWPLDRYNRWLAFYKERSDQEKKAARRAKRTGRIPRG